MRPIGDASANSHNTGPVVMGNKIECNDNCVALLYSIQIKSTLQILKYTKYLQNILSCVTSNDLKEI